MSKWAATRVIWPSTTYQLWTKNSTLHLKSITFIKTLIHKLKPIQLNTNLLEEVPDNKLKQESKEKIKLTAIKIQIAKSSKTSNKFIKRLKCLRTTNWWWANSQSFLDSRSKDIKVQKIDRISKWVSPSKENSFKRCKFQVHMLLIIWCQRVTETNNHHFWSRLTTSTKCRRPKTRIPPKMQIMLLFINNQPNKFLIQIKHFKWSVQWKCLVWMTKKLKNSIKEPASIK